MKKRVLSVILAIMMIATLVPASIFSAFAAEPAYELIIDEDGILTGYTGTLPADLVIPDGVTKIGYEAFSEAIHDELGGVTGYFPPIIDYIGCKDFKSVTIPDSVTFIGEGAFADCTNLKSIILPESVTTIEDGAFYHCINLESVTLSFGLEHIKTISQISPPMVSSDFGAFEDCISLTNITLPDSLISIGDSTFKGCTSLATISVGNNISYIGRNILDNSALYLDDSNWENGALYLTARDGDTYYLVDIESNISGALQIKERTKVISDKAFYGCTGLTGVTIPDSVITNIESSAFEDLTNLESVKIGDGVTSIGAGVFKNCTKLTSVTIGNNVKSIGELAFYGCKSLASITIPDSVTIIGRYAFENCTSLVNVSIGDSVTSIKSCAFRYCTSLESITIPDSVTEIESSIFYGCTSLSTLSVGSNISYIGGALYDIGASILYGSKFYSDDSNWENGALYLTARDRDTFYLLYVKSNTTGALQIKGGTRVIAERAFSNCTSLESITIPDSVITNIERYAFEDLTNLKSVTIGDGVTSIENGAFSGCTSLTSVTIPDGITSIGNSAFYECESLKSITIPDSVTSIENGTFSGCTSLESITIPDSVTSIGTNAFSGCTSLVSVTIPDSVTSIGTKAFKGCTSIKSVTIPGSVTRIEEETFYGCTDLESVTLLSGVIFIGSTSGDYGAFEECTSLTNVIIPDSVTFIGYFSFYGCTSLENITIPNSVTAIGHLAFSSCTSLVSVTIPESVTKFGNDVFDDCSEDLVIYGITGSPAYTYAIDNYITFKDIRTFTVIFKDETGNTIDEQEVSCGETVTAPQVQEVEGKIVIWLDEEGNLVDVENLIAIKDMTLTVRYETNKTVTFVNEDGDVLDEQEVRYGETATAPTAPQKEGYTFLGWVDEDGNKVTVGTLIVTSDMTLIAKYEINKYTVTFVDEDGSEVNTQFVEYEGKAKKPTDPKKEGHTFVGWVDEDGNLVDLAEKEITESMTLTAKYEINIFTVTFFAGARKPGKTEQIVKKVEVAYGSDPSKLVTKDFVKDFDFNTKKFLRFFFCLFWKPTGRWTDANGNVVTKITSNITLYAEYDWFWNV